jgi:tripartite-type tricarboxylate transporter receptor subunit TctC
MLIWSSAHIDTAMQRIRLLVFLLASGLVPLAVAAADVFPSKPVRLVVGFPPGGGIDFAGRTLQPALEAALGQTVTVENRPGGGGVKAATDLVVDAPDGYTLLVANTGPFAIAPHLLPKMPYDAGRQFTYIGQIAEASYIAVTRPDHPAKTLKDFVNYAKDNPGKVSYGTGGPGSSTHLNGELLSSVAGIDMQHVHYKGSAPAIQDLIDGQTQLLIDSGTVLLPHIKAGRLKALAVTGTERDPALPNVGTATEQGLVGMESAGFQGIVAPAGLPKNVVDKLSAELRKVLSSPDIRAKFASAGSEVHWRGPAEFASHVKKESDKWSTLIRKRNIKAD